MIAFIARLRRSESGTSLMEMMFVLAMMAITITGLVRFVMRARGTMSRVEAASTLNFANQRIGENLRTTLSAALVYVADYGGTPDMSSLHSIMANSLTASATAPVQVTFSAQPIVQDANMPVFASGTITAGDMGAYVGNELYLVASVAPVTFTVCLSSTTTAATIASVLAPCVSPNIGYTMSIDRVQFVAQYLAKKSGGMKNGLSPLRLVEWRSRPYVRYNSLSEMAQSANPLLTATCQALSSLGYTLAIADAVSDTVKSYITFNSSASFSGGAAPNTFPEASWGYVDEYNLTQVYRGLSTTTSLGRIRTERTFAGYVAPTTFSFAYNSRTSTAVPVPYVKFTNAGRDGGPLNVPNMAKIDRAAPGFPGGFEVLIVGRPGAREVLVHFTTMLNAADSISRGRTEFLGMDGEAYITSDTSQ